MSLLVEFGGPVCGLLAANLCLALVGAVAIAVRALCSGSAWAAALLTFIFAGRHPGNGSAAGLVGADYTRPPMLRRHRQLLIPGGAIVIFGHFPSSTPISADAPTRRRASVNNTDLSLSANVKR